MQVRWHIARDGWLALALFGFGTIILTFIHVSLGAFALGLMCWLGYILRVPRRHAPDDAAAIVAPADGKIIAIEKISADSGFDSGTGAGAGTGAGWAARITIHTAITDAHLQVAPTDGRIVDNFLVPGLFLPLPLDDLDAARGDNERREIVIETSAGTKIMLVQYGSRYARHLVCTHGEGKFIRRGAQLGMIWMAGVIDVYLPAGLGVNVAVGQNLLGGEAIIAVPEPA